MSLKALSFSVQNWFEWSDISMIYFKQTFYVAKDILNHMMCFQTIVSRTSYENLMHLMWQCPMVI